MPNTRRKLAGRISCSLASIAILASAGCGGGGGSSSGGPPPPPAPYTVTNLGSLDPVAINNTGQVLGSIGPAASPAAKIWQGGNLSPLGAGPATPLAINDTGVVAGAAANPVTADAQIASTLASGQTNNLNIPDSAPSEANGINASGVIVGVYTAGFTGGAFHNQAFTYAGGVETDLPALIGSMGGTAVAINNNGLIAGFGDAPKDHAILWTNGVPQDLGTLGGTTSVATALNNAGTVAGYSDTSAAGVRHAFIWKAAAMIDLGSLSATQSSRALAINNGGVVAGFSGAPFVDQKAVIWKNGVITDLNTMISRDSHWILEQAVGINDAGEIIGIGTLNGASASFILTPNPAATP